MPIENVDSVIEEAEQRRSERANNASNAFPFFEENIGTLYTYLEAVENISNENELDEEAARDAVIGLVDDIVDPVQLISHPEEKYVGIIEFEKFDGGYGYIEYDDTIGKRRNVVCSKCVENNTYDSQVTRFVAGVTSYSGDNSIIPLDSDYQPLEERLQQHYDEEHDVKPENVEVGASLVSGTTIATNTAFHTGNESDMSFFDGTSVTVDTTGNADSVDGYDITKNGSGGTDIINFDT